MLVLIVCSKYNSFSCFKYLVSLFNCFLSVRAGWHGDEKNYVFSTKPPRGRGRGLHYHFRATLPKNILPQCTTGSHALSVDFCSSWLPLRAATKRTMGGAIVHRYRSFLLGAAAADLSQADCSTTKSIDISGCFIGGILTQNMVILSPDKSETGPLSEASK